MFLFSQIGYIEFQLRRVFDVPTTLRSDATRLWISERELIPPRFRLLVNRNRMLNDHLQQRDRKYMLALEVCLRSTDSGRRAESTTSAERWPTGEPGEPRGDLGKYVGLVGRRDDDKQDRRRQEHDEGDADQERNEVPGYY